MQLGGKTVEIGDKLYHRTAREIGVVVDVYSGGKTIDLQLPSGKIVGCTFHQLRSAAPQTLRCCSFNGEISYSVSPGITEQTLNELIKRNDRLEMYIPIFIGDKIVIDNAKQFFLSRLVKIGIDRQ